MFQVGDKIVHPMHGAGVIDSIVQKKVNGVVREYYILKLPVGGMLVMIPTEHCEEIGVRPVVKQEEADRVIAAIPSIEVDMTPNWNRRYRENMLRLKSGDLLEVARVVKGLMLREEERGLSTGERKMLHSAKQILISEIVLSQNASYEDVEDVYKRQGISFPRYSRRTVSAMQFAHDRGATAIALTDSETSPLVQYSTHRLLAKSEDVYKRQMQSVLARVDHRLPPPMAAFEGIVGREPYPVADKADEILDRLTRFGVTRFRALFKGNRSRSEIVATFIAVLELCKARRLRLAGTETDCTVTCTEADGQETVEFSTDAYEPADGG